MSRRIDVVIPVLDGVDFIETAARSVLQQTGVDARPIIVDAGSSDGTSELVASWGDDRITLITGNGRLLSGPARNIGIDASTAPWLCFLDADDAWPPARCELLLAAIDDPLGDMAVGHMRTLADGDLLADIDASVDESTPLAALPGGTLQSRALVDRIGRFTDEIRVGEFVDWIARARSSGVREVSVATVSLLRRRHAANTSRQRRDDYRESFLRIVAEHRARQRDSGGPVSPPTRPDSAS